MQTTYRRVPGTAILVGLLVCVSTLTPASEANGAKPQVSANASPNSGYWLVGANGGIFSFGDAQFYGSMGSTTLNRPVVGMAVTPDYKGYWLVAADGGVFSFGDAQFYGSTGNIKLNAPIVGMAATPDGKGYWLVAADGGVFSFGDAQYHGSEGGQRLNRPIVAMASTPSGSGYWLVAGDGGVFSFGDAEFYGSQPDVATSSAGCVTATGAAVACPSNPIVGMARTTNGEGYWLALSGGAVNAFGNAVNYGSQSQGILANRLVGIAATDDGGGYWTAGTDGGVFSYGDATSQGSLPASGISVHDIVGIAPS